ncbi:type I-E CRISPR-associated protein Cse1/CasA [Streptomyces griseoluteus]|uniref:type I-E CRISPR-associated protein Cse1/CasA n=1 Tax=Streptomyces griseoluteus TaxID=29306 RepID=UPI00380D4B34
MPDTPTPSAPETPAPASPPPATPPAHQTADNREEADGFYCLAEQPWIPAHTQGALTGYGLRGLLLDAHRIDRLALPIPPAESALLRLLTAVTARISGLDDPDMPAEQWHDTRRRLLAQGRFDEPAVNSYLDKWIWELFHPTRPFLQDPALARQCTKTSGVNKLVFGRPAGNNLAWLSVHTDTRPQPVPAAQAAWHLLLWHYYGPSGTCSSRTVGATTAGQLRAGPLRGALSFHPQGHTLFETLLLSQTPYRGLGQSEEDLCPWEEAGPPDPLRPPAEITWPGRLLTARSRHALLLVADPNHRHAVDAYVTWATLERPLPATDPFVITLTDPTKEADRRDTVRRADRHRGAWRDLDALLLAGDETTGVRRPEVFTDLNEWPPDLTAHVTVTVHGFDQDPKTRDHLWYSGHTPAIWTWAQEHNPDLALRISECRQAAEVLGAHLIRAANRAWRESTRPSAADGAHHADSARPGEDRGRTPSAWARDSAARYWPRAESLFWDLVRHRPQEAAFPAFAAEAARCLRVTLTPLLHHYRGAGPALARAVRALHAAGAAAPPIAPQEPQ